MDLRTLNGLAEELREDLAQLGLVARVADVTGAGDDRTRADGFGELEVEVDGRRLRLVVGTRADLRPGQAKELPAFDADAAGDPAAATGLMFADRLPEASREVLLARGWGWVDRRRGHLRLWREGLRLDAAVAPTAKPDVAPRVRDPFTPKGQRVALWLLLHPDEPASPRAIAREIDVSAGQVSNVLSAFAAESLLRRDRSPLVPELFWALADRWKPQRRPLLSLPSMSELATAPELRSGQWILTDTRAASAYGAPVAIGPDYPPDLYVPDQKALTWVLNRAQVAPEFSQRAATVAVAPNPLAVDARFCRTDEHEGWPLAHPVVVALDLAVDRSRGRDVVDAWDVDPSTGVTRVW